MQRLPPLLFVFDLLSRLDKHGSRYRGYIENWFELAGGSSCRGFELPRVKFQQMYDGNPGKSILVRVSARFELARVRVIGSRL